LSRDIFDRKAGVGDAIGSRRWIGGRSFEKSSWISGDGLALASRGTDLKSVPVKDGPDYRRVFDAADDPHDALTLSFADSANSDRPGDLLRISSESNTPNFS
jgi:hypothetical protein